MGYLSDFLKKSIDIDTIINVPDIIIQIIVFVAIMYVANMIYPREKEKLGLIAVVAALVAIFLV